ncbi:hypothetical protein M9Y10_024537 [Tritrichomonas musculus]|uniref:Right handed beta helix domain-containing protein n=1 Tax=Tritrichomonas musculus TaxID=1915356 RepID=A0ABR2HC95_9EUKA
MNQQSNTSPVSISNCVFDDCGGSNLRCFNFATQTKSFTFRNNVAQNMKAVNLSYFGQLSPNNQITTLELENITFRDNACYTYYGGGTGLWIVKVETVEFESCNFINNVALRSPLARYQRPDNKAYYSGDGGAMQYGFSDSISNINLIYNKCKFSKNKAVRHGGALAIQTVGTVEITNCQFEENVANYKAHESSAAARLLDNYYDLKSEGRGGAIYVNPSFSYNKSNTNRKILEKYQDSRLLINFKYSI